MVKQLTIAQKDLLVNRIFSPDSVFHPYEDADGNWIISNEEVDRNEDVDFNWLSDLPEIPYNPKVTEI